VVLIVVAVVGWRIYHNLTPTEQQQVDTAVHQGVDVSKKGIDKATEIGTKAAKEGLKHLPSSSPPR